MSGRFEGRVAIVTGGAAGFGRECARAFGREGAAVAIFDIDDPLAEKTVAGLRAESIEAVAVHADVSKEDEVEAAVATVVETFGGVDILINNAALHLMKYNQPFAKLPRDEVRKLFDVNVIGTVNCTLACRDSMRERGHWSVVNISSNSSYFSRSPYGVSKLAVRGLSVAFSIELAPDRIRVNSIVPGFMGTENAYADLPQDFIDNAPNIQLVHRHGTPDDVVAATLFLCSDDASFITGETLRVTGGYPVGM